MIEIYTDGGCSGNPGPGGWAYLIIRNGEGAQAILDENWGAENQTTNNRMELMAVISALEALKNAKNDAKSVTLYTDSQYVQKGMSQWIKDWKSRGWKKSDKGEVKNQELWQRLDALASEFSVNWVWVKGHAGNKYNERCDALTQKAIASIT